MSDIIRRIEDISIAVVMAEHTDLQAMADLYKRFDEISNIALNESQNLIAKAATAAGKLIEEIITGEVSDKNSAIDVISQTVSAMQAIVVNGRETRKVKFPEELKLIEINVADTTSNEIDQEVSNTIEEKSASIIETEVSDEPSSMIGDAELAADFVSEAREHLHSAEVELLTLENKPKDEETLGAVYRAFHTIKGVAGFLDLKEVSQLAHETENLLDCARKGDILLTGPAIDVTFESVDALKQMIDDVEKALSSGKLASHNELLSKLLPAVQKAASDNGDAPAAEETDIDTSTESDSTPAQTTPEENVPEEDSEVVESKPQEPEIDEQEVQKPMSESSKSMPASTAVARVRETLKIDSERLDELVDTIGELVIAESMVSQDSEILEKASTRATRNLSHLDKITRELQEIGMSLRLTPVRPVFERMARLVRDLSKKSGKKINFAMSGEDTEVDKGIAEKISDPLTHMIRNAVDHGIESTPAERLALGKPEVGNVILRAFHGGGNVHIQVEDDGKGLDRKTILAKAREQGMITDGHSMSDQEVFRLIFAAGLSTAEAVTDVSGRGVGMDVVSRNVQSMRGQVEISSTVGVGTSFNVRLPLTLAIIDGTVISVSDEQYIIPTLSIVESLRPARKELSTLLDNEEMISVRGQLLPLYRLSHFFDILDAKEDPTEALVIIIEDGGVKAGLMVDAIVGQQQTVIKSLGNTLGRLAGISGGTIMSDGRVGLILDVAGIMKLATS